MPPLATDLRKQLERAIVRARDIAEKGARQALEALAVHHHEPWEAMDVGQRELRRRLRAHGRHLGDLRHPQKGTQSIERLAHEVAYEHWHRMLFARFLAENDLLIEPESGVAITLAECEELAREQGEDPWQLAAGFAQSMLPQIFRADSPVFELILPPEHRQRLERLLAELPEAVFTAADAIGWVYQFWQTKKKAEVNASGNKIGADELPAVTQLFTEPYMVSFLLDNSLGAWWAARRLSEQDLQQAQSEAELREKAALPGLPLTYLRFVRTESGAWTPAAGTFDAWPQQLSELKVLDPCCGSGHFLVAALQMLVPMRMELEGLNAREAVAAVLRDNLHGLELDQRCVEIAAFALALAAWAWPGAGGYRPLPTLHLACSGTEVRAARKEWEKLAEEDNNLRLALGWLHDTFRDAPVLGSLINPAKSRAAKLLGPDRIVTALNEALGSEQSPEQQEAAVVAQGIARAAQLLAQRYHLVITNVPYLARGKQSQTLAEFCETACPTGKGDLATVFLERCLEYCHEGGTASIVLPQNWLFLTTYEKFRTRLLNGVQWNMIGRLGPAAFRDMNWWAANTQLLIQTRAYEGASTLAQLDASETRDPSEKQQLVASAKLHISHQSQQLSNPQARIMLEPIGSSQLLGSYAASLQGVSTADNPRMQFCFWELPDQDQWWQLHQGSFRSTVHYGGRENILRFQELKLEADALGAAIRSKNFWGRPGVVIRQMRHLPATLGTGQSFDTNVALIVPTKPDHLLPIWLFCSSDNYHNSVREVDQKSSVTNSTLVEVPFDLNKWESIAKKQYPKGLSSAFTNDPTQWVFHGHPCGSVIWDEEVKWTGFGPLRTDETVLQIAVARLLGYRWPAELDPEMELAEEQRAWVDRCEPLLEHADEDGIVCIPAIRGEANAADRLLALLAAAYGEEWSNAVLARLLKSVDQTGKTLDDWLRDKFFAQHCKLFHRRPFIWHIWDGRRDGFHALVNYHKLAGPDGLGRKTLESLAFTYLGEWIDRQRAEKEQGTEGAEGRLVAALKLQRELENILEGEPPYDLFVRWKSLHEQPLGWDPDINDGVRLNIRPFVLAGDVGNKGAGILRAKIDNTWTNPKKIGVADRGKEPEALRPREDFPWFWGCDPEKHREHRTDYGAETPDATPAGKQFNGKRWNNLHYTRAAKQAARRRKENAS